MGEKELNQAVKEAKAEVAKGSASVRLAQKRQTKFERKREENRKKRNRAEKAGKPKKVAFYQARVKRNDRKARFWHRRELDAIEWTRDWKAALARRVKKRKAAQGNDSLASTAAEDNGVVEGSSRHREMVETVGGSVFWPWCSIAVGAWCMEAFMWARSKLPANPAYSGAWIGWPGGHRVNKSDARRDDILIFDWGDGGITDHVGVYNGDGRHWGGNQDNAVNLRTTPWANVVAVIRVNA